mmetsp:Transcript_58221/g.189770  ORF Transcript_58221/g.189770 Transcript_58221/m.189770 type:complete len:116 (+) Transcript_58221:473-820(+)
MGGTIDHEQFEKKLANDAANGTFQEWAPLAHFTLVALSSWMSLWPLSQASPVPIPRCSPQEDEEPAQGLQLYGERRSRHRIWKWMQVADTGGVVATPWNTALRAATCLPIADHGG